MPLPALAFHLTTADPRFMQAAELVYLLYGFRGVAKMSEANLREVRYWGGELMPYGDDEHVGYIMDEAENLIRHLDALMSFKPLQTPLARHLAYYIFQSAVHARAVIRCVLENCRTRQACIEDDEPDRRSLEDVMLDLEDLGEQLEDVFALNQVGMFQTRCGVWTVNRPVLLMANELHRSLHNADMHLYNLVRKRMCEAADVIPLQAVEAATFNLQPEEVET